MNKPQSPDPLKNARRFVYVATVLMAVYWFCFFYYFPLPGLDFCMVLGFIFSSYLLICWMCL